jgi:hypothetical protein
MLNWLSVNWASLVVGAVVLAIVGAAVAKLIRDKKNHKSTCGCSCASCPSAGMCHRN